MLNDLDCTLTDFAVGVLAFVLARRAARASGAAVLRRWSAAFFASVAAASVAGGLVHGVFDAPDDATGRRLWTTTLLAVGVAGFAAWGLVSELGPRSPTSRVWIQRAAVVQLVGYAFVVSTLGDDFLLGIAAYLPPIITLLVVLRSLDRRGRPGAGLGARALVLSLVAAALQQLGVGLDPDWLDHNALYHVLQAIALLMLGHSLDRLALGGLGAD